MTTAKRSNFFILLGLNPDHPWNQTQFENAVRDKRNEWSRQGAGVARQALVAKQNLALIPEINRLMSDPAERNKEAIDARAELASGHKARQAQFEQHLAFINAKDYVAEAEINKLIDDFKDILSAREIRDRITIKASSPSTGSTKQQLDSTKAKDITDRLQLLHMTTLYELLQRSDKTATPDLCRAAEVLYAEMVHLPATAEVTAKSELAGLAKEVFKTKDMRERYDETLRQTSLDRLLKELDAIMARSTDKELHPKQVTLFLTNAQKEGWSQQEALERLKEHRSKRKWSMLIPKLDPNEQKLLCPKCNNLNDRKQLHCTTCKIPLFIDCPRCSKQVSCEFIACGNCGFPVGNRYAIDTLLQEILDLLQRDNLQRAAELIQEVKDSWPSGDRDERMLKANAYKKQLDARQQAQKDLVDQLDQLIRQKKFFVAREILAKIKAPFPPDLNAKQRTINEAIKQAEVVIQQVFTGGASQDDKIEWCRQALVLCADYQKAQELLRTMPPSAPGNLRATRRSTVVSLAWDPSRTRGCVYKIVRKSGAQPNSIKDGILLDTVTGQIYDDTAPEIGLPLYYAVFAAINTTVSARAAYLSQPVMLVQDVSQFIAQVDNHLVKLSWEPPPHVHAIVIVRKEQSAPSSLSDGVRLPHVAPAQKKVDDQQVQNERVYYYGIYCQFKDAMGNPQTSSGAFLSVKPEIPPVPIADHDVKITEKQTANNNYEVRISWQLPRKGKVIILKSSQPLDKDGQVISEAQLGALGHRLEDQTDSVTEIWTQFGAAYYTPIVIFQQMAYIGTSRQYVYLENVSDLRAQNLGSVIRLNWKWPKDCQEVLISYHTGADPQHYGPDVTTCRLSPVEYDHIGGYYDIHGKADQNYFILVSSVLMQGGKTIPAQGTRVKAQLVQKTVLTYEIKHSTFLSKKRKLHITTNTTGALPILLLISKRDGLPFNKADGEIFHRIEHMNVDKERVIELPSHTLAPGTFGKLFLEEDPLYDWYTIHHPHQDNLRLS